MLTEADVILITKMEKALDMKGSAGEDSRTNLAKALENFSEPLLALYTQKSEKLKIFIESNPTIAKAWSLKYQGKEPSAYLTSFENNRFQASPLMMRCGSYAYAKFTELTQGSSSAPSVNALAYLDEACTFNHAFALMKRLQMNCEKLQESLEENVLRAYQMQEDIQRVTMYGAVGYMMAAIISLRLAKYYWDADADALELYRDAVKRNLSIDDKSKPVCVKELGKMAEYFNIVVLQLREGKFSETNAFVQFLCAEGKIENIIADDHIRQMLNNVDWKTPENLEGLLKQIMTNYNIPMIDRELRLARLRSHEKLETMLATIQQPNPLTRGLSLK